MPKYIKLTMNYFQFNMLNLMKKYGDKLDLHDIKGMRIN